MHCYARMLVRILPLLRQTYNVFSVVRKKTSLVYFSRQGTGSPWGLRPAVAAAASQSESAAGEGRGEAPGFRAATAGGELRRDREQRRRRQPGYCLQAGGHLSSPSSRRHPVTKESGPGRGCFFFLLLLLLPPRPLRARGGGCPASPPPGVGAATRPCRRGAREG